MSTNNPQPPRWPLKLLRFFLKKEYLEEIEGDMDEIFLDNVEILSYQKARNLYAWEALKLLRPGLVKNLNAINLNQYTMFKNYFKVSVRGLMKNPLNSFINIVGLSAAIGIAVFVYAFARWTYSTDQFHEHKHEVFLTTFFADRNGAGQEQYGKSPVPLAGMLREDFVQIKNACRIEDRSVVVKYEDNVFHEGIRFTDPAFLEMFTFPLKWGMSSSLHDLNSIILSEDMSTKYFGEENPIGQSILVKFDQERSKAFKVTGVAKKFPKARTISFNFLINFENLITETGFDPHDWKSLVNATLIQVGEAADIQSVSSRMMKYVTMQNDAIQEDWAIAAFGFEPLATLHKRSGGIHDDISRSSEDNYTTIIYLCVIGGFLLLLACVNYINIAIVSAAKRLKEIGIRKSIGATRRVVIVQFLSENIVITFFAMIMGLILGMTIFIPGFEQMWHFSMDFRLDDLSLWIYLPAILLLTSVASGMYPALYISRFQVVRILKGSVKFGRQNPVTKVFLVLQLVLACMFITSAVMFKQNTHYLSERSWGYNPREAIYAVVPDQATFEALGALMAQVPTVEAISGSVHHLGRTNGTSKLHLPGHDYEVDHLEVDANYFKTMGLDLKEGRAFNDHAGSDRHAVIVNELLVENMAWSDPVGELFTIDTVQYEVIGVVKDFHSYSFFKPVKPTFFKVAANEDIRYLSVKAAHGSEGETYQLLKDKWAQLFPEVPFDGGHQEDVWGFYFEEIKIHGIVWSVFAFIAISLAGLGLYGLMTLHVASRIKEFSIRKVLGAGTRNIGDNIARQYFFLVFLSLLIGAPISFYLARMILLSSYTYHMPITLSGVSISIAVLMTVFVVMVIAQIRKVSKSNPVNGLNAE